MKHFFTLLGLCMISWLNFSEIIGQTTIDLELRPRIEYRQGFRKPLADTLDAALVTLQRTRFNADYKSKILNARISLQDARIWGNNDLKNNPNKLEIYEAWFEYLMTSGFSMQMGRQPLKYDDQRIFGAPAWGNVGVAHDILVLKYNSKFIQTHVGAAYNNTKDTLMNVTYGYPISKNYKSMGYIYVSKPLFQGATFTMTGVCDAFENKKDPTIVYPRFTYGGSLFYADDSSPWGVTLTGFLQSGKSPIKTDGNSYADLNSHFYAAKLSYLFVKKYNAFLGVDYYSGSKSDIEANKSTTYTKLYGAVHNFNGSMEYFATLPTQGLIDYYAGVTAKITQQLSLDLSGHLFYFDKDFVYKKEVQEKNLGSEIDFSINYNVSKEIAIQGGYSQYFNSSSTLKYYKMDGVATHNNQWAYIMFTIKPQLYKTPAIVENK